MNVYENLVAKKKTPENMSYDRTDILQYSFFLLYGLKCYRMFFSIDLESFSKDKIFYSYNVIWYLNEIGSKRISFSGLHKLALLDVIHVLKYIDKWMKDNECL